MQPQPNTWWQLSWQQVGVGLGVVCFLGVSFAALVTFRAVTLIQNQKFAEAAQTALLAEPVVYTINGLTFHQLKDFVFWQESLKLLKSQKKSLPRIMLMAQQPFSELEEPITYLEMQLLQSQVAELSLLCPQTLFVRRVIASDVTCDQLQQASSFFEQFLPAFSTIFEGNSQRYVIIFQNQDELRATGGFMGSYGVLELSNRGLSDLEIQDIYEPDGQFRGFVEPPPGVAQYLSGGNGLRLPDANWYPDFPTSAKTILSYFSYGAESDLDGVIAINANLIESILQITGDIYLPDFQTNVSAENFSQLARADRDSFFPGSKQKQSFLSAFFVQLKIRLSELTREEQLRIATAVAEKIDQGEIQFYSNTTATQHFFTSQNWSGALSAGKATDMIALIESNVGINKANAGIERQVTITVDDYRTTVTVTFTNTQSEPLHYVNYQRLLTLPSARVERIAKNGQPLENWTESLVTTADGEEFTQTGFLVEVPALSTTQIHIELTTQPQLAPQSRSLQLVRQSGLPTTPYTIKTQTDTQTIPLDRDMVIKL